MAEAKHPISDQSTTLDHEALPSRKLAQGNTFEAVMLTQARENKASCHVERGRMAEAKHPISDQSTTLDHKAPPRIPRHAALTTHLSWPPPEN